MFYKIKLQIIAIMLLLTGISFAQELTVKIAENDINGVLRALESVRYLNAGHYNYDTFIENGYFVKLTNPTVDILPGNKAVIKTKITYEFDCEFNNFTTSTSVYENIKLFCNIVVTGDNNIGYRVLLHP